MTVSKSKKEQPKKEREHFAQFCKEHKIAEDKIRWKVMGDRTVKVSMSRKDVNEGGFNILSMAINFALRELDIPLDVTIRSTGKIIEVIVEK